MIFSHSGSQTGPDFLALSIIKVIPVMGVCLGGSFFSGGIMTFLRLGDGSHSAIEASGDGRRRSGSPLASQRRSFQLALQQCSGKKRTRKKHTKKRPEKSTTAFFLSLYLITSTCLFLFFSFTCFLGFALCMFFILNYRNGSQHSIFTKSFFGDTPHCHHLNIFTFLYPSNRLDCG